MLDDITDAIFVSLEGKYPEATQQGVSLIAAAEWRACELAGSEASVLARAHPTWDISSDVANQVHAYFLIERVWPLQGPQDALIRRLHAAVYGLPADHVLLRSTPSVPDFSGDLPVPVDEVPARLADLEFELRTIDDVAPEGLENRAAYLARVYSEVVRIHPFPDGNGRTGRLAVQYCARRWRLGFLRIPKVRNHPWWKAAMQNAMEGDNADVTKFFLEELGRS